MEEWKPVPGYEAHYEVADTGSIRSLYFSTSRPLKPSKDGNGYLKVCLQGPNKTRITWPYVHRVVAAAFLGSCPDGMQVNHINGNKQDNTLCNLEYCTLSENQLHSWHIINSPESSSWSKLTVDKVRQIKRRLGDTTLHDLAKEYGVTWGTISQIATGKTWKSIT